MRSESEPFFESLANLSLRAAYAKFVDGHASAAVEILTDLLTFVENDAHTSFINETFERNVVPQVTRLFQSRLGTAESQAIANPCTGSCKDC